MAKTPYQWMLRADASTYYYINGSGVVSTQSSAIELPSIIANWNEIQFKWQRNSTYWGVFRAQSPDSVKFVLDGAKILRKIYYSQGVQGKLQLVVNVLKTTDQLYYPLGIFDIDFSKFADHDYDCVVALMQGGLTAYLKAYENTKIPLVLGLPGTTNILTDGCTLRYQAQYILSPYRDSSGNVTPWSGINDAIYPIFSFIQEASSVPLAKPNSELGDISTSINFASHDLWQYVYQSVAPETYTAFVSGSFPVTVQNTGSTDTQFEVWVQVFKDNFTIINGSTPLNSTSYTAYTSPTIPHGTTANLNVVINHYLQPSGSFIGLQPGNIVVIFFAYNNITSTTVNVTIPANTDPNSSGGWPFIIDGQFQLNATLTPAYRLKDAWEKTVQQLGYLTSPATLSTYWSGGSPLANFGFASSLLSNTSSSSAWLAQNFDNSPFNTHITCADALAELTGGEDMTYTGSISSTVISGSPVSGGGNISAIGGQIKITTSGGTVTMSNGQLTIADAATIVLTGGSFVANYGTIFPNTAITTQDITVTSASGDSVVITGSFTLLSGSTLTPTGTVGNYHVTGSPIILSAVTSMLLSISDLFQDAFGRHAACLGIETRSGNETIVLETMDYFMNPNTELAYLGEIGAESMEIMPFTEQMANTFDFGFKKQTYDKINGADEFNQLEEYASTVTRVVKKIDFTSPFRADMTGEEFARLNQSQKDRSDPNTNNDIFLLQGDPTVQSVTVGGGNVVNYYKLYRQDLTTTKLTGVLFPETAFNVPLSPAHSRNRLTRLLKSLLFNVSDQNIYQSQGFFRMAANINAGLVDNSILKYNLSSSTALHYFLPTVFSFKSEVPVNLGVIMATNPYGVFRFTYMGTDYSGFVLDAGITPGTNDTYDYLLLSSPLNDLTKLER